MSQKRKETSTDLVPVDENGQLAVPAGDASDLMFAPRADGPRVWSSYGAGSAQNQALTFVAKEGAANKVALCENQIIEVEHVIAHEATTVNQETGEIRDLVRIIMVTPDGRRYASTSEGIRASLAVVMLERGQPPWNPAKRLRVIKTGRMLRVIEDQPAQA